MSESNVNEVELLASICGTCSTASCNDSGPATCQPKLAVQTSVHYETGSGLSLALTVTVLVVVTVIVNSDLQVDQGH